MRYSEYSGPVRMRLRVLKSSLPTTQRIALGVCFALVACGHSGSALAQSSPESFSQTVETILFQENRVAVATTAESPTLLRRLYLSLIGIPPTLDELNTYLSDTSSDRYTKTVEALLSRPEFVEHWAERLDVMLMERRANTNVPQDQWSQWLRDQVSSARPIHLWMSELLVANGTSDENRAIARFLLDRDGDPHAVTRDVGRIYFGKDMQCNQCHDHPAIDSYLQTDYHGLLAFMSAMKAVEVTEGEKKTKHIEEKSASDAPFESVFKRGTMHRVLPHFFASTEVPQLWSIPGEEYQAPAAAGLPSKPIHSRRKQLADAIAQGDLDAYNRNLANRLWAAMFGRGIIEPLDLVHADNPPMSDQLVTSVTARLVEDSFDLKIFVRDLALTEAFKRGSLPLDYTTSITPDWIAASVEPAKTQAANFVALIPQLEASVDATEKAFDDALKAIAPLQTERLTSLAATDTARAAYTATLDTFNKANAEKSTADQALAAANDKLTKLKVASDAITAALTAIGTDAELTASVSLINTKAAAIAPTIAPLEQAVADKLKVVQTAEVALAASKVTLLDSQHAADAVNTRYKDAMVGVNASRIAMDNSRSELARTKAAQTQAQNIIAWSEQKAKSDATKLEHQQAIASAEAIRVQLASFDEQQKPLDERLAALSSSLNSATSQQQNTRDRMTVLETKIEEVSAAKEKLVSVSTIAKNPDSFAATFAELDNTTSSLQNDHTSVQQELNTQETACKSCENEITTLQQSIEQIKAQRTQSQSQLQAANEQVSKCEATISGLASQSATTMQEIYHSMSQRFQTTDLVPLTPEQIGWSSLAVTGVYQNYINKHLSELEKEAPATEAQKADPQFLATRNAAAVRRARAELQGNINVFISLYGAGAGQPQNDFFATADQALFTSNGGSIFAWAGPSGKNVAQRVVEAATPTEAATHLYRGILCREPSAQEIQSVEQYLNQSPDNRARMAQEMVWSLIASAEFRFLQ